MNIETIVTGAYEEVCSVVWNTARKALVFDPGFDAPLIYPILEQHGLTVEAYICTHGHADHINALAEMHRRFPAPVAMHSADLAWAFEPINQVAPYYPVPERPEVDRFLRLENATEWTFADLTFQCMETPGHTPGSCCLLFAEDDIMIAGDTLFKGSCGRTDLPGGDAQQLKQSLNKLKQLPDEIRVYPGHGPDTTIGIERLTNYFMQ
jgi:glyoxylase-like metal-dependent hydrolase (beta-lactamase superfamily II)